MAQLSARLANAAGNDAAVLISGAAGAGKKLLAQRLHALGPRRDGRLTVAPAATLSEQMLDDTEGGTLVLAEVDALSPDAQARVARLLDAPHVRARRDAAMQPRGVRIVATSSMVPTVLESRGALSETLRRRLNEVHIHVPALAERKEDLNVLVCHFLREGLGGERSDVRPGRWSSAPTPAAWRALFAYDFPGNVGELASVMEHALGASGGERIDVHHLPPTIAGGGRAAR